MDSQHNGGIDIGDESNLTIGSGDVTGRDKITTTYNILGQQARRSELPHQPYFFGREEELARIADALDPEAVGWGVLIDGPGGIGKTALAIRAGHLAPAQHYPTKIFLSAKVRELTPHGEQKLEDFMLTNYMALLAELARELGDDAIAKIDPKERANAVRRLLSGQHALIIIDNLETFEEVERERLFQFLRRLPHSCKAIVTSRRRTDVAAEIIRLDRLSPEAAQQLIAKLAERNKLLAHASEKERQQLYEVTHGNPLLIEWIVGQLGRSGSQCRTIVDACKFIEVAPKGNNPLEYVFGDLLDTFTDSETTVLAALSYFTQPAKMKWIVELASLSELATQTALEDLTDRALLVSDTQASAYFLPPLAAAFLRRKRPEVIAQTGKRLTDSAYALALENGHRNYERFPVLEAEWPQIAAALPLFLQGENARLQRLCRALNKFMEFSGRWDELLGLSLKAEEKALTANAKNDAGWRAYDAAWVYRLREQAAEVLTSAACAQAYWREVNAGARERAIAIRLRGIGHRLEKDYPAAIAAYQEALALDRALSVESEDVAGGLNALAGVERESGDYASAERDYREALRIAKKVDYREGATYITGNLAELTLDYEDWPAAEALAHEALLLAEGIRKEWDIGANCVRLAKALARQGRPAEGLPYAQRAIEIFTKLPSPEMVNALAVLKECGG
ncbi:MAG: tetratricopeptide repeat protein [Chloroflexota bacterium]